MTPQLAAHLEVLTQLLRIARPGALFPDVRRLNEWLELSRPGKAVPKVDVHPLSGFPTKKSLERLLERQQVAKAFFEAHRSKPPKHAEVFHPARAAALLWKPGVDAQVRAAQRGVCNRDIVHDRFDARLGNLVRFTVQLELKGTKHARVERGEVCVMTPAFGLAIEEACDAGASKAALSLDALEGVTVTELVRGELGPCATAQCAPPGPLGDIARSSPAGEGVLGVLLERVGKTVAQDFTCDAWPEADGLGKLRASKAWHASRERKLVGTPGMEAALKKLASGTRMLVRCR